MKKAVALVGGIVLSAAVLAACTKSDEIVFHPISGSSTPGSPASRLPLSESVSGDHELYLSGQIGNVQPGQPVVTGGIPAEARQTMENIKAALAAQGLTYADVVKCTVFITDMTQLADFNAVYSPYFTPGRLPARSAIGITSLTLGAHVEVECIAVLPGHRNQA